MTYVLLEQYGRNSPLGKSVDLVFTANRLYLLPSTSEALDTSGKKEYAAAFIGGAAGVLLKGSAERAWKSFKEKASARKIDAEVLDELVDNQLAISIEKDEIQCSVREPERVWLTRGSPEVSFYGRYQFGDTIQKGVCICWREKSVKQVINEVRVLLGKEPQLVLRRDLPKDFDEDSYWEKKILG